MTSGQTDKLIPVAVILKAHGVRGLVKLRPLVEDIALISNPAGCFCDRTPTPVRVTLKSRAHDHFLAALDAIPDRTIAEQWHGVVLSIPRSRMPASSDDDGIYLTDLIGMTATDPSGNAVGVVEDIANFGASDLLEIKPAGQKSFYLPVDDNFLVEADPENGVLVIDNFTEFLG